MKICLAGIGYTLWVNVFMYILSGLQTILSGGDISFLLSNDTRELLMLM